MSDATDFWRGEFGDTYAARCVDNVGANRVFFHRVLLDSLTLGSQRLRSAIEFGCGTGENMAALSQLIRGIELWGVEVNASAAERVPVGSVIRASLLDFKMPHNGHGKPRQFDLAFTKGVLIHIPPEDLATAYQRLYDAAKRYILIAEYFAMTPTPVVYRGHANRLWRRDFAGEIMDAYPDLKLFDYGFCYHRDETCRQDSINWFLLKKGAR